MEQAEITNLCLVKKKFKIYTDNNVIRIIRKVPEDIMNCSGYREEY